MTFLDHDFLREMNSAIENKMEEWADMEPDVEYLSLKTVQHNLAAVRAIEVGDVDEARKHLVDLANYAMVLWWGLDVWSLDNLNAEGADEKAV